MINICDKQKNHLNKGFFVIYRFAAWRSGGFSPQMFNEALLFV